MCITHTKIAIKCQQSQYYKTIGEYT